MSKNYWNDIYADLAASLDGLLVIPSLDVNKKNASPYKKIGNNTIVMQQTVYPFVNSL